MLVDHQIPGHVPLAVVSAHLAIDVLIGDVHCFMEQQEHPFICGQRQKELRIKPDFLAIGGSGSNGVIPDMLQGKANGGEEGTIRCGHQLDLGFVQRLDRRQGFFECHGFLSEKRKEAGASCYFKLCINTPIFVPEVQELRDWGGKGHSLPYAHPPFHFHNDRSASYNYYPGIAIW